MVSSNLGRYIKVVYFISVVYKVDIKVILTYLNFSI